MKRQGTPERLRKPKNTTSHNYMKKLLAMHLTPGHADIYHDDFCEVFKGGFCNCDPTITQRSFRTDHN